MPSGSSLSQTAHTDTFNCPNTHTHTRVHKHDVLVFILSTSCIPLPFRPLYLPFSPFCSPTHTHTGTHTHPHTHTHKTPPWACYHSLCFCFSVTLPWAIKICPFLSLSLFQIHTHFLCLSLMHVLFPYVLTRYLHIAVMYLNLNRDRTSGTDGTLKEINEEWWEIVESKGVIEYLSSHPHRFQEYWRT